jgi:DNA repair protein RecN (Recombination protein N)
MLLNLSINNYAIIEQINLDFKEGFTVITGETGAGKSILLGAISLLLGKRADTSVLNNKDKKCIVEGTFIFNQEIFKSYFTSNDLDFEKETIVRREITTSGKSRAFVNDTPVTLSVLKELTSQLVDIHSQHQTLKLQNNQFQLNVVDYYAQITNQITDYKKQYQSYTEKKKRLDTLINKDANAKSDIDYLEFQINEIEELVLQPNEQKEIQEQLAIINNAETIKQTLEKAVLHLNNSDQNILSVLREIVNSFAHISEFGEVYKENYERLNSLLIELEDTTNEIESLDSSLDFDSGNAQYLTNRLSTIYSLEQKHHLSDSDELIELLKTFKAKLATISITENELDKLKESVEKDKAKIIKLAKKISEKRIAILPKLSKTIINNLAELGMPDSSFTIKHSLLDSVNENGIDSLKFLFSANKGVAEKELEKTASGGELSRLMLTIKSILASNSNVSSIIFDEIDTGVSGDIAHKMATIMSSMSKHIQIIAITHLPQVAAKGESHYKIYKETTSGKTSTFLNKLSPEDRVEEIAKMLSGKKLSSVAKENAKILLEN